MSGLRNRRRALRGGIGVALAAGCLVVVGLAPVAALAAPPAPAAPAGASARPATELRVALGRLLGEHAILLMDAMRAAGASSPDEPLLTARLGNNSDALAKAVGSVYGTGAAKAFGDLWQSHVDLALRYARAIGKDDKAEAATARRSLEGFGSRLDALLKRVNPRFTARDEAAAIHLHIGQIVAFATGDFAAAYDAARESYDHMFMLGDSIAKAIADQFPKRFPDARTAFSPASELRVALDRLLGEHLQLAAEAMRAGTAGAPEFDAARRALRGNSDDLTGAVAGVYGRDAGAGFGDLWQAHVDAYLAYVDAVRTGDTAAQARTRSALEAYGAQFGEFMAAANPRLKADDVAMLISHHTQALLQIVDRSAAGDAAAALSAVDEAYAHMFTVGDALAAAISAQFPDRFTDLAHIPATDAAASATVVPRGDAGSLRTIALLAGALGAALAVLLRGPAGVSRARPRAAARRLPRA